MALQDKLKRIEGVRSILYKDTFDKFTGTVSKKDFSTIKPPFELVIRVNVGGRRIHRTMRFKARSFKAAVKEAEIEREKMLKEGIPAIIKMPTYAQLLDEYLHSKRNAMSESNARSYRSIAKNHLAHILPKPIDRIRKEHLQQAVNAALDAGRAPRTAQTIQAYSRPVFAYAIGKGYIETNPAANLNIPKFDNRRYFQMDEESARRLYRAILEYEEEPYRSIFVWLLHGRRLNEVLSLQWQHIDLEGGTYEIVAANNKARRNKVYPLTRLQREALPKPHGSVGLVFQGKNGGKVNGTNVGKRHWKRVTERAGIVGMRLHDLRHLFGYLAVNVLGLPLEAVAETLGHTSTQVTSRYATVGLKTVERATERMLELLEGGKN